MATQKRANSTIGPIGFSPYKIKKGEKYMNDAQLEHFRNILRVIKATVDGKNRSHCRAYAV